MGQNWLRACSLTISGGSASTLDLGSLRVVFEIDQFHLGTPNMAHFRVYNCAPTTVAALMAKEYTNVSFSAGYQDNTGLIFSGDIKQSISGHETAVDSYVDIFCADSQMSYDCARMNTTLAAGYTPQDKLNAAIQAMAPFGVSLGSINTVDLSQPKYPRGLPIIGMARDVIRKVALSAGALWSTQNGKVILTDKNLTTSGGSVVVLTASTGLIGWPKQTQDGIYVTSLLNPALQPLTQIKLDPSQIIASEKNNNPFDGSGVYQNQLLDQQALGAGTYTIFRINRHGDTRGQEWYDESTCIGVGGSASPQNKKQYLIPN